MIRLTLRQMALRLNAAMDDDEIAPSTTLCPYCTPWALQVNEPIPINLYLCFLSRMVVGSVEDLHEVGVPCCSTSLSRRLESRSIKTVILSGP
jgi:hypothetical protein